MLNEEAFWFSSINPATVDRIQAEGNHHQRERRKAHYQISQHRQRQYHHQQFVLADGPLPHCHGWGCSCSQQKLGWFPWQIEEVSWRRQHMSHRFYDICPPENKHTRNKIRVMFQFFKLIYIFYLYEKKTSVLHSGAVGGFALNIYKIRS